MGASGLIESNHVSNIDWDQLLELCIKNCTALPTQNKIREIKPFSLQTEAETRFLQIEEAASLLRGAAAIRPSQQSLDLYETWILPLKKKAVLKTVEFKDVKHFCHDSLVLKDLLQSTAPHSWLFRQGAGLLNAMEPLSAIECIFTPSGDVRSDASETLFQLIREKENLQKEIHKTLDRLVQEYDTDSYLQEKYITTREGRWVVPVKGGSQHQVKGMIHGHSQTKQTVYMEPQEIIPMNNRLRTVEWSIDEEIERLIKELSDYLAGWVPEFESSHEILLTIDEVFAIAALSVRLDAHAPIFNNQLMDLKELRHPGLVFTSNPQSQPVISNNVKLDPAKSILLLTGPNAGGKTVLLKAIGLASQMARHGIPICAAVTSQIPFFTDVCTAIGDAQSVDEHLSTFAAHIKTLNRATHLSGKQNLLLVDEICGSTDPEEGSALARSFIYKYAELRIFAVVTSHLGPLKVGWEASSPVLQGSLHYDEKTGRPTYQFLPGLAGDSLALQTAMRVGVSKEIIDRAYEWLTPEARARRKAMDDLEGIKASLQDLQKALLHRQKEARREKERFEFLQKELERDKQNILDKFISEAKKNLDTQIATARVEDTFKKFRNLENIKQDLPIIVKASVGVPIDTGPRRMETAEEFSKGFPPGSRIFIPHMNRDGIVQGMPNGKGEIPILADSLRLLIHWKELRPSASPQKNFGTQKGQYLDHIDRETTIDLRGQRVEEALGVLEQGLDLAIQRGEDRIKVIHGHGTEALKRSVRAYLSRSVYVNKWKAGTKESGGDGVTWVEVGKG